MEGWMLVGYARISTAEQNLDSQIDTLRAAGCDRIFTEVASGTRTDRPILADALDFLRNDADDVLVCSRLDRVARSLPHLLQLMEMLGSRGIGFRSLTEAIDTTTPGGRLVFHVFGAIANFEVDLIRSRTKIGLEAARKRGRVGGRPLAMTKSKKESAQKLLASGIPAKDVANSLGVSLATLYRHVPAGLVEPAQTVISSDH
jgi:DNA invertase Pin-like site-specific DNA recombinase